MGYVLTKEPPRGFYVRARYANHHTAGYVWHRDDAEGHPPGEDPYRPAQVWWSHEWSRWCSWEEIKQFVDTRPASGRLVLEPLFAPPAMPGCSPDGAHSYSHCIVPDPEMFK